LIAAIFSSKFFALVVKLRELQFCVEMVKFKELASPIAVKNTDLKLLPSCGCWYEVEVVALSYYSEISCKSSGIHS